MSHAAALIEVHQSGPVSVLTMQGKLVLGAQSYQFRTTVDELLRDGNIFIVLNLKDVSYADSAGMGALAFNVTNVKAAGGQIAMVEVQNAVWDVMEETGLTQLIPMFSTESEAIHNMARV